MKTRFRRFLTAVKENCSVRYAKIVTASGYSDVDLIVIKATAPNDSPLPEKYVQELLKIFAFSPPSYRSFSLSFSRRFRKSHCCGVRLKCLLLLHRLLQSLPDNVEFRLHLLRSRSNGSISLHQCHSRPDEDYDSFIRSYARFLDEALNSDLSYYRKTPDDSYVHKSIGTVPSRINEINRVIETTTQMQNIIDRVIDCKPVGRILQSFVVRLAMKNIIRESFYCYHSLCRDLDSIEDSLLQLPYRSSVAAIGIYKKAAIQANQLSVLYDWCKLMEVCSAYEFPDINRIPESRIQGIEATVRRMWEVTESSSSSSSSGESKSPAGGRKAVVVRSEWEKFENGVKPQLMELEERSWEDLLEASVSFTMEWDSLKCERNGEGEIIEFINTSSHLNPFNAYSFHQHCLRINTTPK
ncbi:putative clathrin assembly protein [Cucumis melo var. makuwa]|uniref:Clathrin assembly protein n=1 Tax=Cucumis melo var. makuwa TaxID=1194695 RepID=A0A5D3CT35_CUCMM|nr:putative clathrin assembly protein [Cucumis melo var. makuwa]TYK14665.1 putative clathrin assembly protein [Cucumis melo var. makuwa]